MKKALETLTLFFIFQLCSDLFHFCSAKLIRTVYWLSGATHYILRTMFFPYNIFNQVIKSKPWLAEPYFYRAVAKNQFGRL